MKQPAFSVIISFVLGFVMILLSSCGAKQEITIENKPVNILWLVTEDLGPYLPAFGDSTIATPNLSRLAREGVVYPGLYSTSGVCAPSRAAIATGMYPSSIGANHMRVNSYNDVTGLPKYEAVPPPSVRMLSELLRENGYYCSNNVKTDYQFKAPPTAWDESSPFAHWRNRESDQPFFSIFNFTVTHESGLFEPYGFRKSEFRHYYAGDTTYELLKGVTSGEETTVHLSPDTQFNIPPYLPNTATTKRDLWKVYNNIAEMDRQLGAILDQLEADGLLESTMIFFYTDHGGPLPRQKRLLYDAGLNSPMIIRFPDQRNAGTKDEQLISFIDFVPSLLSLIGVQPPSYLQGQSFLGKYSAEKKRQYIHAAADRLDAHTDAIRAVRDSRFKYIRNFRPDQGYYLPIEYRERIPSMQALLKLNKEGKLNEIQSQWFREHKPAEELFDCENDPHEINNLADDPKYAEKLTELREEMDRWLKEIDDDPTLEEKELLKKLWGGSEVQPVTANPVVSRSGMKLSISCPTAGASIGYKIVSADGIEPQAWRIYKEPFELSEGTKCVIKAHRIGYKPSKTTTEKR